MEFKGTKEKWQVRDLETHFLIECDSPNWSICNTITDLEQDRANALLISKSPILLEENKNEIEFLKRIKKQLDDLGGSMEYEVEERINYLEKLYLDCVTL
jgi:methylaspartate ammonia-lyase